MGQRTLSQWDEVNPRGCQAQARAPRGHQARARRGSHQRSGRLGFPVGARVATLLEGRQTERSSSRRSCERRGTVHQACLAYEAGRWRNKAPWPFLNALMTARPLREAKAVFRL